MKAKAVADEPHEKSLDIKHGALERAGPGDDPEDPEADQGDADCEGKGQALSTGGDQDCLVWLVSCT